MKRLSLYLFLILFTLQTSSHADDIRDFQIEGMSLGDSLLDYYSEQEIKKQLSTTVGKYKSKKIKRVYFHSKDNSEYLQYNFHFINDSSYRIVNIIGVMLYENKMGDCYKKQLEIIKDIEKNFENATKEVKNLIHRADKSGKSKIKSIRLKLKNGQIRVDCKSWSKKIKKEKPWRDTLSVLLDTDEYILWLKNEAY